MTFRRQLSNIVVEWFHGPQPKPLILRGARQVGKSTLVREFARQQGLDLLEINLERHPELNTTFATLDPTKILGALESVAGKRVPPPERRNESLLFLDEIQAAPHALGALRYLYEGGMGLRVMGAGSLLEFALAEQATSMPVGRIEFLNLHPMSFDEFLEAMGETVLRDDLRGCVTRFEINPSAHTRLLELQRIYLFVGGMPEAVKTFVASKSHQAVRQVHDSVLETYKSDFGKYIGNRDIIRFRKSFEYAALHGCKKVKYTAVDSSDGARGAKVDLQLLRQARLHTQVIHSDANGVPLKAEKDERIFKLLFLDVGLAAALRETTWSSLMGQTESQILGEGELAEQFVGQELLTQTNPRTLPELFYWMREGKSNNAEVDYLWATDRGLLPIEVKAGKSGSLKSLHQFCALRQVARGLRFDLGLPSRQRVSTKVTLPLQGLAAASYELLSLPLYCAGALNNLDL